MKSIKTAKLAKGRNAEHCAFHDKVLEAFTAEIAAELKIEAQREAYAALYAKEDEIFKYCSTEVLTKEVKEKDNVRDTIFTHLKLVVEAYTFSPFAEERAAAETLSYAIKTYRDTNYKAYREETILIKNAINGLRAEGCAASLETLGLTGVVDELEKANNEFDAVSTERADDRLVRDTSEKMAQIRPKVDEAYRTMVDTINSLYNVNELVTHDEKAAQTLGALIDKINREVNEFQRGLSQRGAGKKSDVSGSDAPAPGTGEGEGGSGTPGTGDSGSGTPGTGGEDSGNTGGGDDTGGADFD